MRIHCSEDIDLIMPAVSPLSTILSGRKRNIPMGIKMINAPYHPMYAR